ncbi:MAG TPA: sugar phosphate nucleotidyltransferase [Vicinamibacterales bacterium]|nr:sugar phosphate nucleotidyltransferase [Vicinamibacterales bacterium]
MRAVILAGGKGTRLRPFTASFPKALVPLGDKPVLEVLIEHLAKYDVTDVTLTLGHLAALVRAYFEQRRPLDGRVTMRYVEEREPTGTAGSLSLVPDLNATFLAMNADLLTDLDLRKLVAYHREQQAMLTIATHTRTVRMELGVIDVDSEGRVRDYHEKPETSHQVSMGIYVYEPAVLKHIEPGRYLDFPTLVLRLLERGERVSAYRTDCLWLDIGRPDDYARAQELYAEKRESVDLV